jgi:hypothetical protein
MARLAVLAIMFVLVQIPAWAQTVSGVRCITGGACALFSLVGPGSFYTDSQGTQGYIYPNGTFESYNFRSSSTGQAWSGAMMTLGPQLSVGLIAGGNQVGASPTVFPSQNRILPPLPPIQSSILQDLNDIP